MKYCLQILGGLVLTVLLSVFVYAKNQLLFTRKVIQGPAFIKLDRPHKLTSKDGWVYAIDIPSGTFIILTIGE